MMVAVDQFTDMGTAQLLRSKELIRLITGDNEKASPEILGIFNYNFDFTHKITVVTTSGKCKMHNKFMSIDGLSLMTGSPNLTWSAYNNNIECSIIFQNNSELTNLYSTYFDYIIKDPKDNGEIIKQLRLFHERQGKELNICLAPIVNVKEFIKENIEGAREILINMFLISRANSPSTDIIAGLEKAAKNGASIKIRVDAQQYHDPQNGSFMRPALHFLKKNKNIKIYKVGMKNGGLFHDKLLLIIKNNGDKIVILGSAGFTKSVQNNLNYENMIAIKNNDTIFEYYKRHFDGIQKNGMIKSVKLLS
nr:phospholipase D-like domain-containing protein [Candidatus Paracaedibacter symbiosus]